MTAPRHDGRPIEQRARAIISAVRREGPYYAHENSTETFEALAWALGERDRMASAIAKLAADLRRAARADGDSESLFVVADLLDQMLSPRSASRSDPSPA